jgi:hypothetical protein
VKEVAGFVYKQFFGKSTLGDSYSTVSHARIFSQINHYTTLDKCSFLRFICFNTTPPNYFSINPKINKRMSKVQIVPNASTGAVISAYQSNPEKGFIQLQQTAMQMDGSWIREVKRSTLLKASVEVLEKFVNANPSLALKGQLVIKEYLESDLPEAMAAKYLRKDVTHEEAIAPFVKRAGADGPELTLGGERILRFTIYDASGEDSDITVTHDNQDAVKEFNAQNSDSAELGNG